MEMIIGINEKPKTKLELFILSIQHVFAMFGATVLVPILTGLDVGVSLVASGVGTIIYIICTKGKVPIYLGVVLLTSEVYSSNFFYRWCRKCIYWVDGCWNNLSNCIDNNYFYRIRLDS